MTLKTLLFGFVAGFLAVLIFHQGLWYLFELVGFTPFLSRAWALDPTPPLGVPAVISKAFWGGVWGVVFAAIHHRFPLGARYWIYAFLFGAIFPTLVAWFVVAPLKGLPAAGGWNPNRMLTGMLVNGAWGIGTALLIALTQRLGMRRWRTI